VTAVGQFGSDLVSTGHGADIVNTTLLTHTGPRLIANDALQKVHSPRMLAVSSIPVHCGGLDDRRPLGDLTFDQCGERLRAAARLLRNVAPQLQ